MPLKEGRIAALCEPAYGPVFGAESDIRVSDKVVFSNHHTLDASYERVEIAGVPARELLLGGLEDELVDYEVFQVYFVI
jgi:hypothetical protein